MGPFNSLACARGGLLSDGQGRSTGTTSYSDTFTWVRGAHTWKFGGEFRDVHEVGDSNFGQRRQVASNVGTAFGGFDLINALATVTPDNPGATLDPSTVDVTSLSDAAGAWFGIAIGDSQSQFLIRTEVAAPTIASLTSSMSIAFMARTVGNCAPTSPSTLEYAINSMVCLTRKTATFRICIPTPGRFRWFSNSPVRKRRLLYDNDPTNIEPRVGFSWDPWSNGKTLVRALSVFSRPRLWQPLWQ